MIGPQGTPCHDTIFFFDFAFPFMYPAKPPQVFYRSHGLRLNPNLYKNGWLFLSLLNTAESTILQVLVWIQGPVLNAKPYYNAPIGLRGKWAGKVKLKMLLSCPAKQYSSSFETRPGILKALLLIIIGIVHAPSLELPRPTEMVLSGLVCFLMMHHHHLLTKTTSMYQDNSKTL